MRPNSTEFAASAASSNRKLEVWEGMEDRIEHFRWFYDDLYKLKITQEQSLQFFRKYFPQPGEKQQFLGDHDSKKSSEDGPSAGAGTGATQNGNSAQDGPSRDQAGAKPGESGGQPGDDTKGDAAKDGASTGRDGDQSSSSGAGGLNGGLFDAAEAERILEAIAVGQPTKKAGSNFQEVIRQVTFSTRKPGVVRSGTRMSRRMPAKLNRRDMLGIERGETLFTRTEYLRRKVVIFLDVSGSVDQYLPLVLG